MLTEPKTLVRVIGLYVFDDGGSPVCQCRSESDAGRVAEALNSKEWELAFMEASKKRDGELSALRESHAELVEALTLYVNSTDPIERRTAYNKGVSVISRAQSLTSQQKPCSGHPDANAGAI